MVMARSDTLRAEHVVKARAPIWLRVDPALDRAEHLLVHFEVVVPQRGMMEHAHDVGLHLLDWHLGVIPCVDNAGSYVLEDLSGNLAGRVIKDVGEMILAEEGVSWGGTDRVIPWAVLVLLVRRHDSTRAELEVRGRSVDDRNDVGREEAKDEEGDLLTDSVDEFLQAWDLGYDCIDGAHDVVAEDKDGVDFL